MKRRDKLAGGRWRPGALLRVAAMLAAGALVLAGCGGSSGGSTGTSTTSSSGGSGSEGSTGSGGAAFEISEEDRQCLKEKGVELPEFKSGEGPQAFQKGEMPEGGPPTGGFGGERREEMTKAFEECGVEMPEFKGGPGGATAGGTRPSVNSAAFKKQVKEYVACVRENGYQLAEPNLSGEGPIFEKAESESAAFKKASEQCQSLLSGPQGSQSESEAG
jgi:hypothetical protein